MLKRTSVINILYSACVNCAYLLKSKYSVAQKIHIIYVYLKIICAYTFLAKLLKLKKTTFFGYTVEAFDYTTIRFLFEEIFFRNEYFFESTTDTPVIFDCGANIGFATIFFKWLFPKARIYAFEPDPTTYALLEKNVKNNKLQDVYTYNVALSGTEGPIDFFVNHTNPGSLVMSTRSTRMSKNTITIPAITLSSFIADLQLPKINFVKMDVEGAEEDIVKELLETQTLQKIEMMAIEYHHNIEKSKPAFGRFLNYFEKHGFGYQIDTRSVPHHAQRAFQDILVRVYVDTAVINK
jgi:FkbM family methyltransferase